MTQNAGAHTARAKSPTATLPRTTALTDHATKAQFAAATSMTNGCPDTYIHVGVSRGRNFPKRSMVYESPNARAYRRAAGWRDLCAPAAKDVTDQARPS